MDKGGNLEPRAIDIPASADHQNGGSEHRQPQLHPTLEGPANVHVLLEHRLRSISLSVSRLARISSALLRAPPDDKQRKCKGEYDQELRSHVRGDARLVSAELSVLARTLGDRDPGNEAYPRAGHGHHIPDSGPGHGRASDCDGKPERREHEGQDDEDHDGEKIE
jgi:hypothetical protein